MDGKGLRFGVMGSGGVGGYFGAALARGGADVAMIARGKHLAAIQAQGLAIEAESSGFTASVTATDNPAEAGVCDVVLVAVKLWDTDDAVEAIADRGLDGDRAAAKTGGKRQVTLIQAEHLQTIGSLLGRDAIDPALARRNIVVSGVNLIALKDQRFRIGQAILQGSGDCPPCSRMEENLGHGGYNAMRGLGGITAQVIQGGLIATGDGVQLVESPEPSVPS